MIQKVLTKIGDSQTGQRFFKWASKPESERFLNHTLPQVETVIATGCYVASTAMQKNIDEEQRKLLQIQNIASGVVGLFISTAASKKISKFGEQVIDCLDPKKFPPNEMEKVKTGLRVGLPIATTIFCMRCLIPSAIALFSGKVMDREREKKKGKFDTRA